jgi:hypothetical protein
MRTKIRANFCAGKPVAFPTAKGGSMKVTLRNRKTGEFYNGAGKWVASGLQAHNFGYSDTAEEYCDKLALPDIYVFYIFNNPAMNYGDPVNCGCA